MDRIDLGLQMCFLHFKDNWEKGGHIPMTSILAVKDKFFKDVDWKDVAERIVTLANEDYLDIKDTETMPPLGLVYITDKGKQKFNL